MKKHEYTVYIENQLTAEYKGKILLYGSGVIAQKVIPELLSDGYNISGVIDLYRYEGNICGIPIIGWEDVDEIGADVVCICAASKNHKIIYDRIKYQCDIYGLKILTPYVNKYHNRYTVEQAKVFEKNTDELRNMIAEHEAVSFDMFDTLVMRKTLEPTDVFDIVEQRLAEKGIVIPLFKRKRRTAELGSDGTIDDIYVRLAENLNLDIVTTEIIKAEELSVEKEVLLPRHEVVELMKYAFEQGKKVNVISDMYWSGEVLGNILNDLGITYYNDIFVSSDHGCAKGNGLFDVYKQKIKAESYLHIGDNEYCDYAAAVKHGLDAYKIENALELLKLSSIDSCLYYTKTPAERFIIGIIISVIFNSPFKLFMTSGIVKISNEHELAAFYVMPICALYMNRLINLTIKNNYDGIIFSARDGKLFHRIYNEIFNGMCISRKVPSVYLYTSRKLCIAAALSKGISLDKSFNEYFTAEKFYKTICDITGIDKFKSFDNHYYDSYEQYYIDNRDLLSALTKEIGLNYQKYIEELGLSPDKKYLITDLNGQGTVQYYLKKFYLNNLDGFYLSYYDFVDFGNEIIRYAALGQYKEALSDNCFLIEKIITDIIPSVKMTDELCQPVFMEENRTPDEIELINTIHYRTIEYLAVYYSLYNSDSTLSERFISGLLGNVGNHLLFQNEISEFLKKDLYDELFDEMIKSFQ